MNIAINLLIQLLNDKYNQFNRESFTSNPYNIGILNRMLPTYKRVAYLVFLAQDIYLLKNQEELIKNLKFTKYNSNNIDYPIIYNEEMHNYFKNKNMYSVKLNYYEVNELKSIPNQIKEHLVHVIKLYENLNHNELEKEVIKTNLYNKLKDKKRFSFL